MLQSVLFVVRSDNTFPSCRFRAYQYQEPLERLGVRVDFLRAERSLLPHRQLPFLKRLAEQAPRYDAVVYQKMLHPWRIRLAARRNPNLFYDFDDALYLTSAEGDFERTIRAAPRVIAGNPILAEYARRYSDDVAIVPTTVVVPSRVEHTAPEGPLRVSWIGSACNLHYLDPVRVALRELRGTGRDIHLHILTEDTSRLEPEEGIEVERWSYAAEERALSRCEIGLMPLLDDEWSRGKCACKALQYLSYARPVLASPVGVNRQILENQPYALLPQTVEQWREALESFLSRRAELPRLGEVGRNMVAREYSVDAWAPKLVEILKPRSVRQRGEAPMTEWPEKRSI
ncbi:MAG TPA: hypothetical protein VIM73_08865 [Polyangiaceae bacterium]